MIVVITALIGPAESIDPPPAAPGTRFVCVTDRPDVQGWERWPAPHDADPRRSARRAKTSVAEWFPDAEAVLWHDASFDLIADPATIVADARAAGRPIVAFRHPDRCNIGQEAREIIRLRLADEAVVKRQLAFYRFAGFGTDDDRGPLTTTGLMVLFRSARVGAFADVWWRQLATFCLRDQLSVDYSAWRVGAKIGYLDGHYRDNRYATYNRERHRAGRVMA